METSKNVIQNKKMTGIHNKNFLQEIKFILTAQITQLNEINIYTHQCVQYVYVIIVIIMLTCVSHTGKCFC